MYRYATESSAAQPSCAIIFDCIESLFAEKERSVVAMQQTSLLLRGIPANFSNLTRYAPLLFIFTIKYKHFLRI